MSGAPISSAFSSWASSMALFTGSRIVRDFSLMAFRMAWRIHHTA